MGLIGKVTTLSPNLSTLFDWGRPTTHSCLRYEYRIGWSQIDMWSRSRSVLLFRLTGQVERVCHPYRFVQLTWAASNWRNSWSRHPVLPGVLRPEFCPCRSALFSPEYHSAKKPPLGLKSFETDQMTMLELVDKMLVLQQSWAEPCASLRQTTDCTPGGF
jgi:hypothetical protein